MSSGAAGTDSERCEARVLQRDDRWGGFLDRCDLASGHDGEHRTARTACEPVAALVWTGDVSDDVKRRFGIVLGPGSDK